MEGMGRLYHQFAPDRYGAPHPIWYGGELIGGSPRHFAQLGPEMLDTVQACKRRFEQGVPLIFENGSTIFDNDEYVSSFVYNLLDLDVYDTWGEFSKRMLTGYRHNNIEDRDLNLPIWHLPAEKTTGLKSLFETLKENDGKNSLTPASLGRMLGVPKRDRPFLYQTKRRLKRAARGRGQDA